jgi:hypothetical protein
VVKITGRGVVEMEFNRDDKTSLKIRMSMDLRMELGKIAKQNGMTLNGLINIVLNEYINNNKNVKK